mmetsp:Transcript_10409/g.12283  ORF Transcript_10409/g.12283 Transcript_10409/m.12283 type:complete len:225 (-) Transcript_10409:83-757(-)|eukprot:CAMPEP_0185580306 /NCGR_PEP_ID=MMETSP0434-20130131/16065_1 /TAXON_ID=626734 ORGANISM="Favella taraikaensis, Strain Fe Narragansett Bay" /NCGR_SAMPLE_ID=MMETSP0434 /ASSEMBLY_ACC=CAM_ASM_000379 /LENGTH=224 /DNA_ID=CAMNT_0028198531 /DNA_START=160 /DNA_END=834 /DNA_ORIENTATION=-
MGDVHSAAALFLLFLLASLGCSVARGTSFLCGGVCAEHEATCLFIISVNRVGLDARQLLGQFVEQSLNVGARLGRGLEEKQIHTLGVLLALLHGHLAFLVEVAFVAREDQKHVVVSEGTRILNPLVDRLEGLARCDVVADDGDGAVFDVGRDEGLEAFLAGRVPQIQNYDFVLHVHLLAHEVDADRRLIVLVEAVVDEAVNNARLTHRLVPQEDDFVLVLADAT